MKKVAITFICTFIFSTFLFSQDCLPDGITFGSQQEVDEFIINHPNCTHILGEVRIDQDFGPMTESISNLNGLNQITIIDGGLIIQSTPLSNLSGLENLSTIGGSLVIDFNQNLMNLDALQALITVGEDLKIESNDALLLLNGLANLTTIGNILKIGYNGSLIDLGFSNLTTVTTIAIKENDALINLSGLENLSWLEGSLQIEYNELLSDFSVFNNLNYVGGNLLIEGQENLEDLTAFNNLDSIGVSLLLNYNENLPNLNGLNNLTSIGGSLWVKSGWNSNSALTNLNGLENLMYVYSVKIEYNPALVNLNGLFEHVTEIPGALVISNNDLLTNLAGLENINYVGGGLEIENNNALISLVGLENLTTVGSIYIDSNSDLVSLSGLENLTEVDHILKIEYNEVLIDISSLENLTFIGFQLHIRQNANLTQCSISSVCAYITTDDATSFILYNAEGCNSEEEILLNCDQITQIQYDIYYDANQNGIRDDNEQGYPNAIIDISPNNISYYLSENEGVGTWLLPEGNYQVIFNEANNSGWTLTSNSAIFDLTLNAINTIENVSFGLYPDEQLSNLVTMVNAPNTRCNQDILFDVSVKNQGTTITDGTLWLEVDENVTAVNFIDPPDIDTPPLYGWHFESLYPGHVVTQHITLGIPGPDEFTLGNDLIFASHTSFEDINGVQISPTFEYATEVQCAFDPNDKLVTPNRENNFTLFEEDLVYTIRFQNTGNAEAYDVVIRDTLDANLDWSTFTVLGTSHSEVLTTSLSNEGHLAFEFRNIFLPDSTTNFDASQGYVSYMVSPLGGLAENTSIENTAGIYFDFNPPITTNTTENIMVSELPTVNVAPSSQNTSINTPEDTPYSFTIGDFPFSDPNGDDLDVIKIISLPAEGVLEVNDSPIPLGFELDLASINDLLFIPTSNEFGTPYTSFEFSVSDGQIFSDSYTATIAVEAINDAPTSDHFVVDAEENMIYTFSANDFPFLDIEGDELQMIKILSLPTQGVLSFVGNPVNPDQNIDVIDIAGLQFTPGANEVGQGYASFNFTVSDGMDFTPEDYVVSINVWINVSDVEEAAQEIAISLGPNPTAGFLNVSINWKTSPSNFTMEIVDVYGRQVVKDIVKDHQLNYTKTLDLNYLASGMYFLRVNDGRKSIAQKFILK